MRSHGTEYGTATAPRHRTRLVASSTPRPPAAAMVLARAVHAQLVSVLVGRVALVLVPPEVRVRPGQIDHHRVTRRLGQDAGRRHRGARQVGLHLGDDGGDREHWPGWHPAAPRSPSPSSQSPGSSVAGSVIGGVSQSNDPSSSRTSGVTSRRGQRPQPGQPQSARSVPTASISSGAACPTALARTHRWITGHERLATRRRQELAVRQPGGDPRRRRGR